MNTSSTARPSRPLFVVIEGLDGTGTTTQSMRVVDELNSRGQRALLTREPSDGPIGALIRQMLAMRVVAPAHPGEAQSPQNSDAPGFKPVHREALALLFAADRLDHLDAEVKPALARGSIVVSDRYYHSSLAYQGDPVEENERTDSRSSTPIGEADQAVKPLDLTWVSALNSRAVAPDLTIFLEGSVDLCLERLKTRSRRDIFETREQLTYLSRAYAQVLEHLQARGERIVRLDAGQTREELSARIVQEIEGALSEL